MDETPLGIADFPEIREAGLFYADKTRFLYHLVKIKKPYFLSRPRRFGKTLLVSTLEAILQGRRELFEGLWIDGADYGWEPSPVIRLSLSSVDTGSVDKLEADLYSILKDIADREDVTFNSVNPGVCFRKLIEGLRSKYGRSVAVLIDEYDSPILSKIADESLAKDIRDTMGTFYGALKDAESSRGVTFITGITKFAQTSVFSKLNNLVDLTLNGDYACICGLTLEDLDRFLAGQAGGPDPGDPLGRPRRLVKFISDGILPPETDGEGFRARILERYDGYSWDGRSRVLNPWSVF
ncbi:MAG: AAA family ATPase, partial [Deltaproteobacteria bacterium]|nr:AAA family ATPase [Deltaproteobacteria bacterium]